MVKNRLPMPEMQVQSLGRENTLEKGLATHSSILAWEIPWTEEPGRLQFMDLQKSQTGLSDRTTYVVMPCKDKCHHRFLYLKGNQL